MNDDPLVIDHQVYRDVEMGQEYHVEAKSFAETSRSLPYHSVLASIA